MAVIDLNHFYRHLKMSGANGVSLSGASANLSLRRNGDGVFSYIFSR